MAEKNQLIGVRRTPNTANPPIIIKKKFKTPANSLNLHKSQYSLSAPRNGIRPDIARIGKTGLI